MIFSILMFCFALILLWKSSDYVVEGGLGIASHFNLSPLVVGLTFIAFGTSAPELVVNVLASLDMESNIVWGNILGSNISNTCLILGLVGLISVIKIPARALNRDTFFNLVVTGLILLFIYWPNGSSKQLALIDGIVLLLLFIVYMGFVYKNKESIEPDLMIQSTKKRSLLMFLFGLILMPIAGKLVVDHALALAVIFGMSELFVSLFLVALGTSLPELVTSVNAAIKGHTDMVAGNILGSNIFNFLLILGVSACINPVQFSSELVTEFSLLLIASFMIWLTIRLSQEYRLHRITSFALVSSYIFYVIYIGFR